MGLKRFSFLSVVPFVFIIFSPLAMASDQKLYLGASVGASGYGMVDDLFYELGGASEGSYDVSDTGTAYQLQLGWEISRFVAIEAAFSDFGDAESEYRILDGDVNGHEALSTAEHSVNLTSTSLSLKGMLPLGGSFRVFGKVGYASWTSEVEWNESLYFDKALDTRSVGSEEVEGEDLFFALGPEYHLTKNFVLFAEYFTQQAEYDDVTGYSHDWFEASAASLGLRWQFDVGVFNRNGPDAQYGNRKVTACDDKYKDIAGAICNR